MLDVNIQVNAIVVTLVTISTGLAIAVMPVILRMSELTRAAFMNYSWLLLHHPLHHHLPLQSHFLMGIARPHPVTVVLLILTMITKRTGKMLMVKPTTKSDSVNSLRMFSILSYITNALWVNKALSMYVTVVLDKGIHMRRVMKVMKYFNMEGFGNYPKLIKSKQRSLEVSCDLSMRHVPGDHTQRVVETVQMDTRDGVL